MKVDRDGHNFAGTQLSGSPSVFCPQPAIQVPIGSKLQPEIIDVAEQFQQTHLGCLSCALSTKELIASLLKRHFLILNSGLFNNGRSLLYCSP
jgi:hypothetical protein